MDPAPNSNLDHEELSVQEEPVVHPGGQCWLLRDLFPGSPKALGNLELILKKGHLKPEPNWPHLKEGLRGLGAQARSPEELE